MAIGIDPTVDYAFKLLLGSPEHPAITLHFLNAILGDEIQITDVEIINPIMGKEDDIDKLSILDVAARDSTGRLYDIEMQTSLPAGLSQRLAYYTASMYVSQMGEGDGYTLLRPAISICVLDAVLFRDSPQIHSDFQLRSREGNLRLTDGLQIHLLELPKYPVPSDNRVITDPVEAWLYFFRQADEMTTEDIEQRFNCPAFTEAAEVLEMIQRTPEQRSQYELRLKAQRDERARMQHAVEQARLEGKAEGRAEGKAEGEALGEVKGRIQLLSTLLNTGQVPVDGLAMEQLVAIESDLQRRLRDRGV
ncbi:Rpn family recombination-promoting nuclease/putative transposase [Stieleria sp. TO1_6]|uniref:Rpn family recombination-promoting nuclease/putative transposase n=1 Tax=Stieleria tagensis TaxID=2956795 RepID=UPI00209A9205|nr:Rpn family recombination-promoting nuclease/putative transposase [Stieleria tagensis]MCO8124828.1 Rpn family recombination-promoting nuclease/putative transposase [Stieleria tagensis]